MENLCLRMNSDTMEIYESLPNTRKGDGSGPLLGIFRTNIRDVGVEDVDLQRVARARALDVDRAVHLVERGEVERGERRGGG